MKITYLLGILGVGAVIALLLGSVPSGYAGDSLLLLARGGVVVVPTAPPPPPAAPPPPPAAPPPPPPPPPPPREFRTVPSFSDIQKVAPPPEVGAPAGTSKIPWLDAKAAPKPKAADLSVVLGMSNRRPAVGERVMVNARLRNSGNQSLRRVRVRFYLGGRQLGVERRVDLPAGAAKWVSSSLVAVSSGRQRLRVQVNPGPGGGKQVTFSRSLDVQSAPEGIKAARLKPKKTAKRVEALPSEGRDETEVSGGKFARLPQYRGTIDKPQTKPEIVSPRGDSRVDDSFKSNGSDSDLPGTPGFPGPPGGFQGPEGLDDLDSYFGKVPRGPKGDGIQGITDQEDMPDFGGTGPPFNPVGGPSTSGHGFGKDRYGVPMFKIPLGGADDGYTVGNSVFLTYVSWAQSSARKGIPSGLTGVIFEPNEPAGTSTITIETENQIITQKFSEDGTSTITSTKRPVITGTVTRESSSSDDEKGWWENVWDLLLGMRAPEQEGGKINPKSEPQLLFKIAKHVPQKPKIRPDEGVSDPAGAKLAKAHESRADSGSRAASAAGTQAGADIKWKFIGKKPGSEVTDPAEPQGPGGHGTPDGYRTPQGFLVMDPAEPEAASIQTALATVQTRAAKGASGQTVAVASVTGSVQKLTERGGQKGWVPLKPGDNLGQGSIIRVDKETGGEVGFSSIKTALSKKFRNIHKGVNHNVYIVVNTRTN
jgi:hypothetical protein